MDEDDTVNIIKSMIRANEPLPNAWARLLMSVLVSKNEVLVSKNEVLVSKIETLNERVHRLEEVLNERTRRLEGENEALRSQLNSSKFYLFIFISCFIYFIYFLLFFFSFSKRCKFWNIIQHVSIFIQSYYFYSVFYYFYSVFYYFYSVFL